MPHASSLGQSSTFLLLIKPSTSLSSQCGSSRRSDKLKTFCRFLSYSVKPSRPISVSLSLSLNPISPPSWFLKNSPLVMSVGLKTETYFLNPFSASTVPGIISPNFSTSMTTMHHWKLSGTDSHANLKCTALSKEQFWVSLGWLVPDHSRLHAVPFFSLKPWPNGTPNSSQLEPSYKIKLASAGGQTVLPSRASSQENHSIFLLKPRSHITITKQLGDSWIELTEVAKRWKTWLELGENLSLIKFKPTRSNSLQVGGQTIPNSIEVVNLARVGLSWEDRLASALVIERLERARCTTAR